MKFTNILPIVILAWVLPINNGLNALKPKIKENSSKQMLKVSGQLTSDLQKSLPGVKIEVIENGTVVSTSFSVDRGKYSIQVPFYEKSTIKFSYKNYFIHSVTINPDEKGEMIFKETELPMDITLFRRENRAINPAAFKYPIKKIIYNSDKYKFRVINNSDFMNEINKVISISSEVRLNYKYNLLKKPFDQLSKDEIKLIKSKKSHDSYQKLLNNVANAKNDRELKKAKRNLTTLKIRDPREKLLLKEELGLENALVELLDEGGNLLYSVRTNSEGHFNVHVLFNKQYTVRVSSKGYRTTFLTIDTKNGNASLISGLSLNEIRMYFKSNKKIKKTAFDLPYATMAPDNNGSFSIKPNPEFRNAINSTQQFVKLKLIIENERGENSKDATIYVYRNGNKIASIKPNKNGKYIYSAAAGYYYEFIVDNGKSKAVSSLGTSGMISNSDLKKPIKLKMYSNRTLINKHLLYMPSRSLKYNQLTKSFVSDQEKENYFLNVLSGKIQPAIEIQTPILEIKDSILSVKKFASKEELQKFLITDEIRKILRSKEERARERVLPQADPSFKEKSEARKKTLLALMAHNNKKLNREKQSSFSFKPKSYFSNYHTQIGYEELNITKVTTYQNQDIYSHQISWVYFSSYYKNEIEISEKTYNSRLKK